MPRKPKVYLASPFFNEDQRALVKSLENLIEGCNYECYSPSRDGIILKPDASVQDRQKVLDENIAGINNSDLIIGVMDQKDSGTLWELGFAYANHKPIITMSNINKPINVMIGMTVIAHAENITTLSSYLSKMRVALSPITTAEDYAKVVATIQQMSRVNQLPVF